jgi:hypothetical protein
VSRIFYKTITVKCPQKDCRRQRDDEFLLRYEVEEDDNGVKTVIGRKAIEDVEAGSHVVNHEKRDFGQLRHPCPWCGVVSVYTVPL